MTIRGDENRDDYMPAAVAPPSAPDGLEYAAEITANVVHRKPVAPPETTAPTATDCGFCGAPVEHPCHQVNGRGGMWHFHAFVSPVATPEPTTDSYLAIAVDALASSQQEVERITDENRRLRRFIKDTAAAVLGP